jgi:hypothetical protein
MVKTLKKFDDVYNIQKIQEKPRKIFDEKRQKIIDDGWDNAIKMQFLREKEEKAVKSFTTYRHLNIGEMFKLFLSDQKKTLPTKLEEKVGNMTETKSIIELSKSELIILRPFINAFVNIFSWNELVQLDKKLQNKSNEIAISYFYSKGEYVLSQEEKNSKFKEFYQRVGYWENNEFDLIRFVKKHCGLFSIISSCCSEEHQILHQINGILHKIQFFPEIINKVEKEYKQEEKNKKFEEEMRKANCKFCCRKEEFKDCMCPHMRNFHFIFS